MRTLGAKQMACGLALVGLIAWHEGAVADLSAGAAVAVECSRRSPMGGPARAPEATTGKDSVSTAGTHGSIASSCAVHAASSSMSSTATRKPTRRTAGAG